MRDGRVGSTSAAENSSGSEMGKYGCHVLFVQHLDVDDEQAVRFEKPVDGAFGQASGPAVIAGVVG